MKKFVAPLAAGLALAATVFAADPAGYQKVATAHDLMKGMIKPNMNTLADLKKAGGPADIDQWKSANAAASVIGEGAYLLLMADRVKDDAWKDGAEKMLAGARATMQASMRQDAEGWADGLAGVGSGCRTCHEVHKPKE